MLTKEELSNIFKNDFYSLFQIPKEQLDWTFSYPLIPIGTLIDSKEILKENGKKYKRFNEYFTFRGEGQMFTYSKSIVPISVTSIFVPEQKCNGKTTQSYFCINVNFLTIDDAAYYLRFNFENADEYKSVINAINEFLEKYTYMPDSLEFENYWKDYPECTIDFN